MKTYKFTINGNKYSVDITEIEDNQAKVEVNGTPYTLELDMSNITTAPKAPKTVVKVAAPAPAQAGKPTATVTPAQAAPTGGNAVKSPLPGVVLDVFVKVGDSVTAGQRLLLLEAMKMENNIDADKAGVIKEIRVQRNDSVMEGDVLLVIG